MNRTQLKLLAIIAMTLDHVAYEFLRYDTLIYQIMRFCGRITAPIMCYLLVEGFLLTSSRRKYLLRLLLFAFVSHIPFVIMEHPMIMLGYVSIWKPEFNMLFTLSLCLVMLIVMEKCLEVEGNTVEKFAYIGPPLIITMLLSLFCDWLVFAPLFTAVFYLLRGNRGLMLAAAAMVCVGVCCYSFAAIYVEVNNVSTAISYGWYNLGVFMIFPLLNIYNHENGKHDLKYFFYAYYPLHITVIDIIKYFMLKK